MKLLQAHILLCSLLIGGYAAAEVRTITATGEYRMGDNDTRSDAKRLALLDAKRLALEQAGTCLESVTEVKSLQVSHDELRAYTAGIVEVIEQTTKDMMEGATHIVRVEVTAKIDTDVAARQIDALRRNESVKAELVMLRAERDQLKKQVESKTRELAALKSKDEVEATSKRRQQIMTKLDLDDLLARAWVELAGQESATLFGQENRMLSGNSTPEGRKKAKILMEEVMMLDPGNSEALSLMGLILFEEGDNDAAVHAFRMVVRDHPEDAIAHSNLGNALKAVGNLAEAIDEYRKALNTQPKDASLHYNLGNALAAIGDQEGAIKEYRTTLALQPQNALAHTSLGIMLEAAGDLDGAIAEFQTALKIWPDDEMAHYGLGVTLKAKGKNIAAAREFREYLRLAPKTAGSRKLIERAQAHLSELER